MTPTRTTLLALAAALSLATAASAQQDAPRGIAPLGILNKSYDPGAKPGADALTSITEVLRQSRQPEIAVLYTTFGLRYRNLGVVVRPLIEEGRAPRITIYLLNGPGRRNSTRQPFIDFRPDLNDRAFTDQWAKKEAKLVGQFEQRILAPTRAFVERMNALATAKQQPLPTFVLVPELEDNFGADRKGKRAYRNLLASTRQAMAGLGNVAYRRNPLPRFAPYGAHRLAGLPLEVHHYGAVTNGTAQRGDTVIGDGSHFFYPGETKAPPFTPNDAPAPSFAQMRVIAREAQRRGIGLLLWRGEWQGLDRPGASGDPNRRSYSFPLSGSREAKALAQLMRLGKKISTQPTRPPVTPKPQPPQQGVKQIVPQGTKVDGPNEFVWKPESDGDKKLVVLLPTGLTGQVRAARLLNAKGKAFETGRGTGVANGGREHFRFSKPGRGYKRNTTLEVELKNGKRWHYLIPLPALRHD